MGVQRAMLTEADREEISRGIAEGEQGRVIAARIGRCPSIVSRDVARHGGRAGYRAVAAHGVAAEHRRRPKSRRLDADPVLRRRYWASCGRAAPRTRWRAGCGTSGGTHAERVAGSVSHEAIYTWIYALPKGETRRAGDPAALGAHRPPASWSPPQPGRADRGMTSIDARPAEAADRAVPGHWEGDLVIGKAGRSAMGALVERTSRYTVPVALPGGKRDAVTTCNALIASVRGLPTELVRTLTWDQGSELAGHAAFSLATTVQVYFAHPHSLGTRDEREHCEYRRRLGWADQPGWCRQLEVTLENTDRLVGVSFV